MCFAAVLSNLGAQCACQNTAVVGRGPSAANARVPEVFPGEHLSEAIRLYGRGTKLDDGAYRWQLKNYRLMITVDEQRTIESVYVAADPGPVVTTDGVVLGVDVLSQFKRKLDGRIFVDQETLSMGEGLWYLVEHVQPPSGTSWAVTYYWYLNETIPSEERILHRFGLSPTPAAFSEVPVQEYRIAKAPEIGY